MPAETKKPEDQYLPASVQYYRWEHDTEKIITSEEVKTPYKAIEEKTPQEQEKQKSKKTLTSEDLEGDVLDKTKACNVILKWLEESGNPKGKCLDSIKEALGEAQRYASKAHHDKGMELPIRLRKHSKDFLLHRIAMTEISNPGGLQAPIDASSRASGASSSC